MRWKRNLATVSYDGYDLRGWDSVVSGVRLLILLTAVISASSSVGRAEIIFTDNFSGGASPQWGNEIGSWTAGGGVYSAASVSSFPNAHSSLPFVLTEFSVDLDINNAQDGGIWLRSAAAPGTAVGRKGVLLVTGGFFTGESGLYWHVVTDGSTYGDAVNAVSGIFTPGVSDLHLRVEVTGNTYSAYVNGASQPVTTLTTDAFPSGQVALYDFTNQTFDNVALDQSTGGNAADDFSPTFNPNGPWSYGNSTSLGGPFALYEVTRPLSSDVQQWHTLSNAFYGIYGNLGSEPVEVFTALLPPTQLIVHPGPQGQYSIVRWTAPAAGSYQIAGSFRGLDFVVPPTTDAHILLNSSTSLFTTNIDDYDVPRPFSLTRTVSAGDTIDFAVGIGSNGNYLYDSTGLQLTINEPGAGTPTLSLGTESFRFSGFVGGGAQRQALQIGTTSGTLSWQATATVLNGTGWLVATPPNGTALENLPSTLTLDVNFGAFSEPGTYQAEIVIEEASGGVLARVPITVVVSPAGSRLLLSQSAFLFRTIEGGTAPAQVLRVVNGGQGSMSWTIPAPQSWLGISSLSGTASAGGGGSSTTLSINTEGLAAGVYQELVEVSAPGAANNPQLATVTLHVAPESTPASPELSSNGILFVIREGEIEFPVFDLFAGNTGGGSATFQFETSTESGGSWLSLSPTSGSVGAQGENVSVELNLVDLPLGIYRGLITASFTPGGTREVEVVLVFAGTPFVLARDGPTAAQCAASSMEMVVSSIGTGSVAPVSFPRPLVATVVDSCGEPLDDATVVAKVEGRTISLEALGNGEYIGTWAPEQESASTPVTFLAVHPTYPTVQRTITVSAGEAAGGVSLPLLLPDGVVEGAAFTRQVPLAPGSIVSLFGSRFAAADMVSLNLPLERDLGGVSVRFGREDAPLYFAGSGQINAQVPYGVRPGESVPVAMRVNGQWTAPQTYQIAPAQPNIFVAGDGWAILDAQVPPQLVTAENPAHAGDVLQIYATGLGETDPPGQTGEGAPAFSQVVLPVTVTVGGVDAAVEYAGLAPGFVGLYQVNARVPTTVTPGDNVEVVIHQNGISSNPDRPATIPVQ